MAEPAAPVSTAGPVPRALRARRVQAAPGVQPEPSASAFVSVVVVVAGVPAVVTVATVADVATVVTAAVVADVADGDDPADLGHGSRTGVF